jgi:hypothetical protein
MELQHVAVHCNMHTAKATKGNMRQEPAFIRKTQPLLQGMFTETAGRGVKATHHHDVGDIRALRQLRGNGVAGLARPTERLRVTVVLNQNIKCSIQPRLTHFGKTEGQRPAQVDVVGEHQGLQVSLVHP